MHGLLGRRALAEKTYMEVGRWGQVPWFSCEENPARPTEPGSPEPWPGQFLAADLFVC